LCSRQAGKSTASAALAVQSVLLDAPSLVLLVSPSQRQSQELYRKCADIYKALGKPVATTAESSLRVEFQNGSRILALPGRDDGVIRGFSAPKLVICDEAARIGDHIYRAIRPTLSVSRGALLALSTPMGRRGWFYDEFVGETKWTRIRITADMVGRISPEFLREEKESLGEEWYMQEYFCEFRDLLGACFRQADIDACLVDDVAPLFQGA
jgi:hypothetical protein